MNYQLKFTKYKLGYSSVSFSDECLLVGGAKEVVTGSGQSAVSSGRRTTAFRPE